MFDQERERHALEKEHQPVSGDQSNVVTTAERAPLSFVEHLCGRLEEITVTEQSTPQSQVHILEVSKEALVETAQRLQERLAVKGGAGTDREDLASFHEVSGWLLVSQLLCGPRPRESIPGVIDSIRIVHAQHLGSDGTHLRPAGLPPLAQ